MNHRRLVGIDLGIATAHTVRVLDGEGTVISKRKAWPAAESLSAAEAAALAAAWGHQAGGGDRADWPGLAAGRGVLRRARAPGVPGLLAEGRRPVPVFVPACQSNGIDAGGSPGPDRQARHGNRRSLSHQPDAPASPAPSVRNCPALAC
jgi:hypothetical protein